MLLDVLKKVNKPEKFSEYVSITYTETVHLLQHSRLLSGSEIHDL